MVKFSITSFLPLGIAVLLLAFLFITLSPYELSITFTLSNPFTLSHIAGGGGGKIQQSNELESIRFRWGLEKIKAPKAWKVTQGDQSVTVAVIDSGIDYEHKALKGRMWINKAEVPGNRIDDDHNGYVDDIHGWDFRDNDNDSLKGTPLHWHGTFVAGIVGATIDHTGIAGVAPKVKIMDLRFLDSQNRFYSEDWKRFAKAINYAVNNGADIINLSIYSNYKPPYFFRAAIKRAVDKGTIVVGISGNNSSRVQYPGKYEFLVTTSAINKSSLPADFSNFGPEVTVAAPGDRVISTIPGGKYTGGNGTSFAAPHVAGMVALLLSINPDLNFEQILQILEKSSVDLGEPGRDDKFGYGLLDAHQALKSVFPNHKNADAELNLEPVGDSKNIPLDLDKDGFYEDVNGDGKLSRGDLTLFGFNLESPEINGNWRAFDFSKDGGLDFQDVICLKEMVNA